MEGVVLSMINLILGIFIFLHGLVHLWYFTLSQRLIQFQAEMGWTGKSWFFTSLVGDTPTRSIASVLYILATLGFIAGGIGIFIHQTWWRPTLMISAIFSSAVILLFWDGNTEMLVQKGLIGFFINIAILVILLVFPK
jgi:hypothetical protein